MTKEEKYIDFLLEIINAYKEYHNSIKHLKNNPDVYNAELGILDLKLCFAYIALKEDGIIKNIEKNE